MPGDQGQEKLGFRNKYLGGFGHSSRSRSPNPGHTAPTAKIRVQHGAAQPSKRLAGGSTLNADGDMVVTPPNAVGTTSRTIEAPRSSATKAAESSGKPNPAVTRPVVDEDSENGISIFSTPVAGPLLVAQSKSAGALMWSRAFEKLEPDELKVCEACNLELTQDGNFQDALLAIHTEAERQKSLCQQRETFTLFGRQVNLRDKAEKLVGWISKIQDAGDILASTDPHAGIPWAVVKFLIKAGTADFDERSKVIAGMETSMEMINRLQVYMEFLEHVPAYTKMRENYESAMIPLMTILAKFLIRAVKVESQGGRGVRLIKAIWSIGQVEGFETDCAGHVRQVEDCAQACHRELSYQTAEASHGILKSLITKMDDINTFKNQIEAVQVDVKQIWKQVESSRRGDILSWISNRNPEPIQRAIERNRTPKTSQWILEEPEFEKWKAGAGPRLFWLHGLVGSGKTFLTSSIIRDIRHLTGKGSGPLHGDCALAYYYCEKGDSDLNYDTIMRCLLKQMAIPSDDSNTIHSDIIAKYEEQERRGNRDTPYDCSDVVDTIKALAVTRTKIFLIIDALDECMEDSRKELLDVFDDLLQSNGKIWICLSSRPEEDIKDSLPVPSIKIAVEAGRNTNDIRRFINVQLDNAQAKPRPPPAGKLLRANRNLVKTIAKATLEKSDGMFQWVALQMNQLLQLRIESEIRVQLDNFPRGLDSAYQTIFKKIENADGHQPMIARRAFQWIYAASDGRIRTDVLEEAVWQDYTLEEVHAVPVGGYVEYILNACQNLIRDEDGECTWAHISVREYIESHKPYIDWMADAMVSVGATCLLVLNESRGERENTGSTVPDLDKYAEWHWKDYAVAVDQTDSQSHARQLLRNFLRIPHNGKSPPIASTPGWCGMRGRTSFVHPLWPVCQEALESCFSELQTIGFSNFDLAVTDGTLGNVMDQAIRGGSELICKALLKLGARPSETGLDWMGCFQKVTVLNLLIEHLCPSEWLSITLNGAMYYRGNIQDSHFHQRLADFGKETNGLDWYSCFEIRRQIRRGDEEQVRAMLNRGVKLDSMDVSITSGRDVLSLATKYCPPVVPDLLARQVNPNGIESYKPLLRACGAAIKSYRETSREFVDLKLVELLLEHGADPNKIGYDGASEECTPLSWVMSSYAPFPDLALCLIDNGADPNIRCVNMTTEIIGSPLAMAIFHGWKKGVLGTMIDKGALVDGAKDTLGSPLRAAMIEQDQDAIRLLFERGADARKLLRKYVEDFILEQDRESGNESPDEEESASEQEDSTSSEEDDTSDEEDSVNDEEDTAGEEGVDGGEYDTDSPIKRDGSNRRDHRRAKTAEVLELLRQHEAPIFEEDIARFKVLA